MPIYIVTARIYIDGKKYNKHVFPFYYEEKEKAKKAMMLYIENDKNLGFNVVDDHSSEKDGILYEYQIMKMEFDHVV